MGCDRSRRGQGWATIGLIVAFSGCAGSATTDGEAPSPDLVAQIDSIFADVDSQESPGYVLGVLRGGQVWYGRGYGMANLDHGVPLSVQSVFNVASLSKQFTGAAIALQVHRGAVSLTDGLRQHFAEAPEAWSSVQVQHLVYMTSGLPEYYELERPGGRDWYLDHFTVDDAIASVFAQPDLRFPPGSAWAYSNANYQLLAEIVARTSGIPFSAFVEREIFGPLGMDASHVNDDLGRIVPGRVTGYNRREDGTFQQEIRRSPHYGGSGVFTTVADLGLWAQSIDNHALAGPEFTDLLLSTRRFDHDKDNDAFGLVWGDFEGRRTLWYEGGDLGFSSYFVHLPDDDVTVIVLSNVGTGRAFERARSVLAVLLPQLPEDD